MCELVPVEADQREYRAWGLMTSLQSLNGYPEAVDASRRERIEVKNPGENWLDQIDRARRFEEDEPEVMVVGAGHSGVMIAARLQAMGVRTLVIEKSPRVGDIWRNRYHTLQLHNEIFTIDFPYTSYPRNWPVYLPKDMYAAWLEFYATAMELSVWTSMVFEGATYDEADGRWTAHLKTSDGSSRMIRPQHIVLATGGVSGRKTTRNSRGWSLLKARSPIRRMCARATNIGAGRRSSSAPARVAMMWRSNCISAAATSRWSSAALPTSSASIRRIRIYALYKEGRSIDEVDVVSIASDFPTTIQSYRDFARRGERHDSELLDGLRKMGSAGPRLYGRRLFR